MSFEQALPKDLGDLGVLCGEMSLLAPSS
jgi:hypothetical protein